MNSMYFILIAVIVLVVAIDLYLKKKNKKSDSTDVDFPGNISKPNNFLIISIVSIVIFIISFFSANKYIYDGELTNSDDGISLVDNIIYQKLTLDDLVEQDSVWLVKSNMSPVSCIVRENGENLGLIIDGFKQGLWQERYKNGQLKYKKIYKNSSIDVSQKNQSWYENGQLESELLDNNFTSWYESGQLHEKYSYLNGEKDGLYKSWWLNGSKMKEAYYKNGKRHGLSSYWKKDGALFFEMEFKNGDQISANEFYSNGQLKLEHFWNNYDKVKIWNGWHQNGKKSYEVNFGDGSKQDWKNWDKNGNRRYIPLSDLRKIIEILGCTDKYAVNYDKKSTKDDGSCYFRLGQKYQGGTIFHLNNDKKSGLIVALLDTEVYSDFDKHCLWTCKYSQKRKGFLGTSTKIGSGRKNTKAIIDAVDLPYGCRKFAANMCYNLNYSGYNDWYLPSLDEFLKITDIISVSDIKVQKKYADSYHYKVTIEEDMMIEDFSQWESYGTKFFLRFSTSSEASPSHYYQVTWLINTITDEIEVETDVVSKIDDPHCYMMTIRSF